MVQQFRNGGIELLLSGFRDGFWGWGIDRICRSQQGAALAVVAHAAQGFVHAVAHDHVAGDLGGFGQVIGCTGGEVSEHEFFGSTSAQQHTNFAFQLGLRHQVAVFGGALDGVAQRADAACHDGHLVHRVAVGQGQGHQHMAHFMMGHRQPLLGVEHAVALFQARHDALDRCGEVGQRHTVGLAARGHNGRFIHQIGQVGSGEARGDGGHIGQRQLWVQ